VFKNAAKLDVDLSDFNALFPGIKHDLKRALRAFFVRVIGVKPHHSRTCILAPKMSIEAISFRKTPATARIFNKTHRKSLCASRS
jgi:hypothetical protein